jgi:hypothetical protein
VSLILSNGRPYGKCSIGCGVEGPEFALASIAGLAIGLHDIPHLARVSNAAS